MRPLVKSYGEISTGDFVSRQDSDKVHPQLAGNVGKQPVAVGQLHQELGVGEGLNNDAFDLDHVFFGQAIFLPSLGSLP